MGEVRVLARTAVGGMASRKRLWAWRLYLLAGVLAIGAYFSSPSAITQDVFTILADLSMVAAIAAGVLMHRPSHPLPWYLFAIGMTLVAAGDTVWAAYENYLYPSTADVLYLACIPFFVVGLLLIGRGGIGRNGANLIDPLIIATGVG